MGLVNCKECQKEVSELAKICPHCGVKYPAIEQKAPLKGCRNVFFGIIGIVLVIIVISTVMAIMAPPKKLTEYELKHGEAPTLWESDIKKSLTPFLTDPDSLVVESFSGPFQGKDGWSSTCTFRSKNGFGGYSTGYAIFIYDKGLEKWTPKLVK